MEQRKALEHMVVAKAVAAASKDPKRKVGAIIIGPDGEVRCTGRNGFPRGVNPEPLRRVKPLKLLFTSHAEENAIAHAARVGTPVKDCTIVVTTLFPCVVCARLIIQSGIKHVIAVADMGDCNPHWVEQASVSTLMFNESGVSVSFLEENHGTSK